MDEERNADLVEGAAAAQAILHRANDAVAKEERLEAVAELQSRVEDWKGHKLDHFGELLLYGNFTVLKGEGAKEVEREVRNIFDSQNPKCRAILRRSCPQVPNLRSSSSSRSWKRGFLAPLTEKSPSKFQSKLEGVPEEILYDASEEPLTHTPIEQSIVIAQADRTPPSKSPEDPPPKSSRKKSPRYLLFPKISKTSLKTGAPAVGSPIAGSPMAGSPIFGFPMVDPPMGGFPMAGSPMAGSPMTGSPIFGPPIINKFPTVGSPMIPPRTPSLPYTVPTLENDSQISLLKPSDGFDGIDGDQPHTPSPVGKAKTWGLLSTFGNSFVLSARRKKKLLGRLIRPKQTQDCDCFFYVFNGLFKPSTDFLFWNHLALSRALALPPAVEVPQKTPEKKEKDKKTKVPKIGPTTLENHHADELGLDVPVRIQYKVYLFQRILLCCKEINPNKPKNKMLGTSKPLTDKKGKLRLQLKGRIFMQNVTDVVSVKNGNIYDKTNLDNASANVLKTNNFTRYKYSGKAILAWKTL